MLDRPEEGKSCLKKSHLWIMHSSRAETLYHTGTVARGAEEAAEGEEMRQVKGAGEARETSEEVERALCYCCTARAH